MSEIVPDFEPLSDEQAAAAARRQRRRRRAMKRSRSKVWIVLGGVAVLAAGMVFGARLWIKSYLQSDRFRVWMSREISDRLHAEVTLDRIQWQDASASVGSFAATGSDAAAFSQLEAQDLRATINAGAIWDRVWQVDEVRIGRMFLDYSAGTKPPPGDTAAASAGSSAAGGGGLFAGFLPNRTVVKGVQVDHFGLLWKTGDRSAKASGVEIAIKPSDGNEFFLVNGRKGRLELSVLPHTPVALDTMQLSFQGGELTVEEFRAEAGGADVTAEGTVLTGDRPSVDLRGTVERLDLAKCLPEDWLKRLSGKARGQVRVTGNPQQPDRLAWRGTVELKDSLLEGLPLLHVIAKKTRNELFIRLILKDARTDFFRTSDGGWLLEKLRVDAPGLLRLKGTVSADPDETLSGELMLGIVPGTLRFIAGAEQGVFLPLDRMPVSAAERALFSSEDSGLLWTRLRLSGTLDHPREDLADRLAQAWFNATADEVMNMSMDGAVKAAETASRAAADAAGKVLEDAPAVIEKGLKTGTDVIGAGLEGGAGLLEKGVEGGLRSLEGLIPGGGGK